MICKHCGLPIGMTPRANSLVHLGTNKGRCESDGVPYGHLAEPVGTPCRADGPNPCLGASR